jgi:hypothetical protein
VILSRRTAREFVPKSGTRYNHLDIKKEEVETIRRVKLGMKEQETYEAIKELAEHGGNKERAALVLGCTRRSINRYIAGYKAEGRGCKILGLLTKAPEKARQKW